MSNHVDGASGGGGLNGLRRKAAGYLGRGDAVPVRPSFSLRSVAAGGAVGSARVFPFDQERAVYTFSGSGAIYQAARVLGLGREDNVLVPAYNCGHEVEPFLRQHVGVRQFGVRRSLQVDIDHLCGQIDRGTRAVLVTHYFGFPQALEGIRSICDERGLFLVEDCCHGLFSREGERPLGTVGDLAVFSMRKSLPLPNGGALVVNNPDLKRAVTLTRPPWRGTLSKVLDLWVWSLRTARAGMKPSPSARALLLGTIPFAVARKLAREFGSGDAASWYDPDDEAFQVDERTYSWGMAGIGRRVIGSIDPGFVVRKRRSNYEYLVQALGQSGSSVPIHGRLPAGVCPLYLPLICDEPAQLVRELASEGIGAIFWWHSLHPGVSLEGFPDVSFLKGHVVALPIHQDLTSWHLERIAEAVRRFSGRGVVATNGRAQMKWSEGTG